MTDPFTAGALIHGLFWATEQIWQKGSEKLLEKGRDTIADAALSPLGEGLKE